VAWAGITENEARAAGVKYGKGVFPWAASGRSLSLGRAEGMTKLLFDDVTGRVIGCGIVGTSADPRSIRRSGCPHQQRRA
jgi:dihydrolipoamide dehydrogenase